MPYPSPAAEEQGRLRQLQALRVLDTDPEPMFDTLAGLASAICGTPIALVSLIDADRQWFKANVGLPGVRQTPRDVAFCDHAIRHDGLFEVGDATLDARFADNPLVTGGPEVRFYAGVPLVLRSGDRIGTLCVIDRTARRLTPEQADQLQQLARAVAEALEMRRDLVDRTLAMRDADERVLAESESRLRAILDLQSELVSQATPDGRLLYVNPAYAAHLGRPVAAIIGSNLYDHVAPQARDTVRARLTHVLASGETLTSENAMATPDGRDCWMSWTNTRQFDHDGRPMLHSTGRDVTARVLAERRLRTSQEFLSRTGQVAGVGGWAMDLRTQEVTWSDETFRLHELSPGFKPTLEAAIGFYAPDSRVLIERAVAEGIAHGTPWDLELQLVTARGRTIWARAVGAVEFEDGQAVRLIGAFQDITEQRRLREQVATSELFLRQLTDGVPVRLAYLDRERRYRFVNEAWCQATGLNREAVIGRTRAEVLPGQDGEEFRLNAARALAGEAVQFETTETMVGQARRLEHRLRPDIDEQGQVRGFFVSATDITERSAAEAAAHAARLEIEHQRAVLQSVADAIPSTVSVMDRQGRYQFVNRAFLKAVGRTNAEILGRRARSVLGDAEIDRRQPWIEMALQGLPVTFELEDLDEHGKSYTQVEYLPLREASGEVDSFVVVTQDITARKREDLRLLTLSQTDPLTGLLNRAGFQMRLENMLDEHVGESLALLYLDLDRFKAVNDTHGHAVGDELLKMVGRRLSRILRPTDAVARLGGDEFAILLRGVTTTEQAGRVAAKIVELLREPFELRPDVTAQIGGSVGGAVGQAVRGDWTALLERADRMLYQAKAAGRDRYDIQAVVPRVA